MFDELAKIIEHIFEKLSLLDSVLLLLLFSSWGFFYIEIKTLWKHLIKIQNMRIEENKKIITTQDATTLALNQLTEVIKISYNLITTVGKK